jgi:AraC-like DNA-binding protein
MFKSSEKEFTLIIPPWPNFIAGSYRYFCENEKHVTRICKDYVLLFILKNSLNFTEDKKELTLNAGEWYIQLPGLMQVGEKGSPSPEYYYIHFQGEHSITDNLHPLSSTLDINSFQNSSFISLPTRGIFNREVFIPYFDQIDNISKRHPANLLGQQAIFLAILSNIISSINTTKDKTNELAIQVMDYLAENYNKPITSEDLQHQFHFTSDYITRKMKHYCGITPHQYLLHIRIEKTKELLANTDLTMTVISNRVGYNDLSVLYKSFCKQTGTNPSSWRTLNRGLYLARK